jgi:hypothetical protein
MHIYLGLEHKLPTHCLMHVLQVQYLATFGSTTLTDTVCGIMKALMTNTLSLQFNWIGSRGKQSFDKLQMSTFICG